MSQLQVGFSLHVGLHHAQDFRRGVVSALKIGVRPGVEISAAARALIHDSLGRAMVFVDSNPIALVTAWATPAFGVNELEERSETSFFVGKIHLGGPHVSLQPWGNARSGR